MLLLGEVFEPLSGDFEIIVINDNSPRWYVGGGGAIATNLQRRADHPSSQTGKGGISYRHRAQVPATFLDRLFTVSELGTDEIALHIKGISILF